MQFVLKSLVVFCLLIGNGCADKKKEKPPAKPLPEMCMGKPDAPIVVIDYSSLTCHHCAQFHTNILPDIEKKFIEPGLVRIIFRDYPGDQVSLKAHQVAWCKGELKYLDFIKLLYANQEKWLQAPDPEAALKSIALQHGITPEQFEACIKNQELMDQILQVRLEGKKKYKITATPTMIINAKIYPEALSLEKFEEAIEPLLPEEKEEKKKKS